MCGKITSLKFSVDQIMVHIMHEYIYSETNNNIKDDNLGDTRNHIKNKSMLNFDHLYRRQRDIFIDNVLGF